MRSLSEINIAHLVDVDGIHPESGTQYQQTVDKARQLLRTLEAATQALYDDGAVIFMAVQSLEFVNLSLRRDYASLVSVVETVAPTIRANYVLVAQTLESLLAIGHDQSTVSRDDHRRSLGWRESRINVADGSPAAASRLTNGAAHDNDVPSREHPFAVPPTRTVQPAASIASSSTLYNASHNQHSQLSLGPSQRSRTDSVTTGSARTDPPSPETVSPLDEDLVPFADEDDRK